MKCEEFKTRLLECIEQHGDLENGALGEHARTCEACRPEWEDARNLEYAIGSWSSVDLEVDLTDLVVTKLAPSKPAATVKRSRSAIVSGCAAALAPLILLAIGIFGTGTSEQTTDAPAFADLAGEETVSPPQADVAEVLASARDAYRGLTERISSPLKGSAKLLPTPNTLAGIFTTTNEPATDPKPKDQPGVGSDLNRALKFLGNAIPGVGAL